MIENLNINLNLNQEIIKVLPIMVYQQKKNKGGYSWNCVIIGDKEVPKYIISKWKIQIKTDVSKNYSDFYIGIGPSNFNSSLYNECWSLYSSGSLSYCQIKEKKIIKKN